MAVYPSRQVMSAEARLDQGRVARLTFSGAGTDDLVDPGCTVLIFFPKDRLLPLRSLNER